MTKREKKRKKKAKEDEETNVILPPVAVMTMPLDGIPETEE